MLQLDPTFPQNGGENEFQITCIVEIDHDRSGTHEYPISNTCPVNRQEHICRTEERHLAFEGEGFETESVAVEPLFVDHAGTEDGRLHEIEVGDEAMGTGSEGKDDFEASGTQCWK